MCPCRDEGSKFCAFLVIWKNWVCSMLETVNLSPGLKMYIFRTDQVKGLG